MSHQIFLVGLPGAGKTTMGLELGLHLTAPFIDLDQEIEKSLGQTVVQIFDEKGEAYFRQLEKEHLEKTCQTIPSFVMATGGGTPCFLDNLEFMRQQGSTVFINTSIETIKKRLEKDSTRPLMKQNSLEELFSKRINYYTQANYTIESLDSLIGLFPLKS